MEFIVNGVAKYNSEDGTLFCPESSVDMITLTRVANELLLLFINNNNVSLRRDDILNELWGKKGLSASSNNLNNYVSMLRKALEQCGCAGLITTIPKYGFVFEADIVLITPNHSLPVTPDLVAEHLVDSPAVSGEKSNNPTARYLALGKLKVAVAALIFIIVFISPDVYNAIRFGITRTAFFSLENCKFYFVGDWPINVVDKESISMITSVMNKNNLNCGRKANIYYFGDNLIDSLGNGYSMRTLSYCPEGNKAPCENYYIRLTKNS